MIMDYNIQHKPNIRAAFDWLVLKPLWFIFILLAIFYFIRTEWTMGILMIVMDFLLSMVGASLHKEKSFHELAQGYPSLEDINREVTVKQSKEEYYSIAKSIYELGFLFFLASLIITFNYGLRWYYIIGISVMIGSFGPLIWAIPFWLFLLIRWRKRKNKSQK